MPAFPDLLNGIFEFGLSYFILKSIQKIRVDKKVLGFYMPTIYWTTAWGLYNIFYYPYLGQWFSFVGGITVVTLNLIWLSHYFYYKANALR